MSYHDHDDHLGRGTEAIPLIEHTDGRTLDDLTDAEVQDSLWARKPHNKHLGSPLTWCPTKIPNILTAATYLLVITTVLSAVIAFANVLHKLGPSHTISAPMVDVRKLRQPSLYLGLERVPEIESNGLTFGSSYNSDNHDADMHMDGPDAMEPKRVAKVSSLHPNTKFRQDGWVFITETEHTIFNLSVPSGAGENCALHAFFPSRSAIAGSNTLLTLEHDPSLNTAHSTAFIMVAALQGESLRGIEDLTWATRPPSTRPLGSLAAEFGSVSDTSSFSCPSSVGWMLVEAGCEGQGCRVEYKYRSSVEGREPLGIELRRV